MIFSVSELAHLRLEPHKFCPYCQIVRSFIRRFENRARTKRPPVLVAGAYWGLRHVTAEEDMVLHHFARFNMDDLVKARLVRAGWMDSEYVSEQDLDDEALAQTTSAQIAKRDTM